MFSNDFLTLWTHLGFSVDLNEVQRNNATKNRMIIDAVVLKSLLNRLPVSELDYSKYL